MSTETRHARARSSPHRHRAPPAGTASHPGGAPASGSAPAAPSASGWSPSG